MNCLLANTCMVSMLVSCEIPLSLNALVFSQGTIFRRVSPEVENVPSMKGLHRVNVRGVKEGVVDTQISWVNSP